MGRSLWKGPFLDKFFCKNSFFEKTQKIWSRRSIIPSFLIGKNVFIHNGKVFKKVTITREKIGYKFGEFCSTRQFVSKSTKINSKIKKR
jgi:ribosomal protein S19